MRISYLGPAGTYSEIAARTFAQPHDEVLAYTSLPAALHAAERGETDVAVLPIENILEGSVTVTLDLLIHDTGAMPSFHRHAFAPCDYHRVTVQ
jgi:prephenate dehydratase